MPALLDQFFDLLFPPRDTAVLVRALSPDGLLRYLKPEVITTESGLHTTTLLPYREPLIQAAILETKFHGSARTARALGYALAGYLHEFIHEHAAYEQRRYVLVPVPLSRERLRERGYNQVERVLHFARAYLHESDIDTPIITDLLIRTRHAPPQTSLSGTGRRANLHNAFCLTRTPDPSLTYLLIDDVLTTGATLSSATLALLSTNLVSISLAR